MKYEIAVVIINYNSSSYTINCIKSIIEKTDKNTSFQLVIVDNASQQMDYEILKTYADSLDYNSLLIRSKINTGFGGGNMLGVNHCNANYISFVNNDTIFQNDCLNILKVFMDSNSQIGVCGPQAYKESGELLPTIDHFASLPREIVGRWFLESINSEKYPARKQLYTQPTKAQFVAGSFMFFRTTDFNDIGGFDTNIFLYYEETDLCKRLLKIGQHAYLVPLAKFTHFHGASTKKSIDIKIELKISLLYVIRKHYGLFQFWILLLYFQLRYLISSLFKPKYFKLWLILIAQAPLSYSLKSKQKINNF